MKIFRLSQQANSDCNNEKLILGYYGFWVKLTYLSAVIAMIGIYFALNGSLKYALICLMVSGLCDGFDGKVANLKERDDREKSYGIQIDALADIICFGLLPAIIGYMLIPETASKIYISISIFIFILYALSALIRLAYFNVIETELVNRNEKRIYFEGLPVTSAALIIPVVFSVCGIFNFSFFLAYNITLFVLSVLFVLKIKIPKPRGRSLILVCLTGIPALIYIIFFGGC